MSIWKRFYYTYGYWVANLIVFPAVLGGIYYLMREESMLRIGVSIGLTAIILALVMSEIKDLFAVKIHLPYRLRSTQEEDAAELKEILKENKLKYK